MGLLYFLITKTKKMKFLFNLIVFIALISISKINAQTFVGTNGDIPSNSCGSGNIFTSEVSGIGIIGETKEFTEIVINITHSYDPDLDIFLIAPDGTEIELSTDNGDGWFGNNDNYTDTHFTPIAATSITDGDAPFTGDFSPEGDFNDLMGINADGIWKLKVCDDAWFNSGALDSWEITFSDKTSIPIELTHFEGKAFGNKNEITWSTYTESNSDFYLVERSINLMDWKEIDEIEAAGISKNTVNYLTVDYSPEPKSYYRLKMVDKDGGFQYSNTIVIISKEITTTSFDVFPNPSNGSFNIEYKSDISNDVNIFILNQQGARVFNTSSSIYNNSLNKYLNATNLENGIYNIVVEQNGQITSKRIVIQK